MRAPKAVHMLIEVHHLKTVELIRNVLDPLLLAWLLDLDSFGVPSKQLSQIQRLRCC